MTSPEQSDIEAMTDEQIIDMAVAAGLGRRMRPIGNPCQGDVFATDATYRIFARRLAAVALHPAPPPSKERLTQLLILTQFVRADAVDNAEDYDAGVTVMRIEWLHQKLAAEAANADQGRSGSLPSGGAPAARSADSRDALRYRWLRDAPATQHEAACLRSWLWSRPGGAEWMDAAIDAAMGAAPSGPPQDFGQMLVAAAKDAAEASEQDRQNLSAVEARKP
jgi:hypothetical protein